MRRAIPLVSALLTFPQLSHLITQYLGAKLPLIAFVGSFIMVILFGLRRDPYSYPLAGAQGGLETFKQTVLE